MSWWDTLLAVVDVTLVAYILYRLFLLIRGTRAVQLINGIFILLAAYAASKWLELNTLNWILDRVIVAASVALPIVFQPELRKALEHLGRGRFILTKGMMEPGEPDVARVIDQVVRAAEILSRNKTGALVVLERETKLGEIIDGGIKVDGLVSWEMLTNIFIPNTPLHDGAVVIRDNRVAAAACWLPLAQEVVLATHLGSRHRAGVGITEQSDAVAVIVSEETGIISIAQGGKLVRELDEKTLREMLASLLPARGPAGRSFWSWGTGDVGTVRRR